MVRFMSELVIKCVSHILMVLWHLNPLVETQYLDSIQVWRLFLLLAEGQIALELNSMPCR